MKKIGLIAVLFSTLAFSESFIELGEPVKNGFMQNQYTVNEKVNVSVEDDFKKGSIEISLSEEKDIVFDNLNKEEYEFLASNFMSTFGSPNSKKIFVFKWETKSGKLNETVCFKKALKLRDISGKSNCAISDELGTTNISEYREQNSHMLICKQIKKNS